MAPKVEKFGVEIELLIKPKAHTWAKMDPKSYDPHTLPRIRRLAVHESLVELFNKNAFPMEILNEESNYHEKWLVASDSSITEFEGFFGIEIISMILYLTDPWIDTIKAFWQILDSGFEIRRHPSCGTHVHCSIESAYTLAELKQVAKFTTYFEPTITELLPSQRRTAVCCQPNASSFEELSSKRQEGREALFKWIESFS